MEKATHPQTVGYLLEYITAFAVMCNVPTNNGIDFVKRVKAFPNANLAAYLDGNDSSSVFFPDTNCGPDIVYKSYEDKSVVFVQVKFWKQIPSHERLKAYRTTDYEKFYLQRNSNKVIRGCETKRNQALEKIAQLKRDEYTFQQIVLFHTAGKQPKQGRGALLITKDTSPDFFDCIDKSMWDTLDKLRNKFDGEYFGDGMHWTDNDDDDQYE
ncbi:hypothetical protein MP638_007031 [Amoeboaphelidium occidentale]|nr:hypothetical protein MP638_007031 [Amoeboaphelidium occidentale]